MRESEEEEIKTANSAFHVLIYSFRVTCGTSYQNTRQRMQRFMMVVSDYSFILGCNLDKEKEEEGPVRFSFICDGRYHRALGILLASVGSHIDYHL